MRRRSTAFHHDFALAVLIRAVRHGLGMDDAEAVQSLLDLAGGHRRTVVGHQRPGQPALHQRLAQPVDEDLGGLGEVPLEVAAEAGVVVEEAEQDGRLPLAGGGQHPALAVMHIGVPQSVTARDLVAQHLARFDRASLGLARHGSAPAPAHQPQRAHHPGQRRVRRHRPQRRVGIDTHLQVVVVQLRRPRRMVAVLLAQLSDKRRRHRPHASGVGARACAKRPDRVLVRCPRAIEPPLDRRGGETHRPLAAGVLPVLVRQPLELCAQSSRGRRRGQKWSDDREAQPRPAVTVPASVAVAHRGIPPCSD